MTGTMDRNSTYFYEVDRGAYSKDQEQKHLKVMDREELMDRGSISLYELMDRNSTYLYVVNRGAYHSKEQGPLHEHTHFLVVDQLSRRAHSLKLHSDYRWEVEPRRS